MNLLFKRIALLLCVAFIVAATLAAPAASGGEYSVVVLGDLHYDGDTPKKFHGEYLKTLNGAKPKRLDEFKRNAKMWAGPSRKMLEASGKCVPADAAFVLQLGDLIQGDCESATIHTQMLAEATAILETTYPGLPIVTVCGNHDIRQGTSSQGATKAYCQFMLPYLTRQLAGFSTNAVTKTTFGFRRGPDLWIFADFNVGGRDLGVIKQLLADNEDARYTFFCSHAPVIPSDISAKNHARRGIFLGAANNAKQRRELRALLAKRNVIVLCGHLHDLEHNVWQGDGGSITEMLLNSVLCRNSTLDNPAEPEVVFDSPAKYGDWPADKVRDAATAAIDALFAEYRPGLKIRYAARAAGHYALRVSDSSVTLDYYGLDATSPTKTFVLR
jgi:predicted MPP superfamily phosphohydrolase